MKSYGRKRADNVAPGYLKATLCAMDIDGALKKPPQRALDIDAFISLNLRSQYPRDWQSSARLIMISTVAFLLIISYRKLKPSVTD